VDNINVDLVEIGWRGMWWIGVAQDRKKWRALVNAAMNLLVPYNTGKLSTRVVLSSIELVRWLIREACLINFAFIK
jgi:hypothetical protein